MLKLSKQKLNDLTILNELKNSCYIGDDVRASWIGEYDTDTDINEFKNYAKWSLQHWNMYYGFFSHIKQNKINYILDAACGTGYNTKMLSEHLPESIIFGVDLDKNSIRLANKYNSDKNIVYKIDDLLSCAFEVKFNYIYFVEILEHIKDCEHYIIIDKLLGLLEDDGYLFITTPNELDNKDATHGHIGFLNRERAQKFIKKYENNIVMSQFYDNSKLDTDDYIIDEPIHTYQYTSSGIGGIQGAPNKSHFKIILKK